MKRYRVLGFSFDSRASILNEDILDSWDESIKKQHLENKENVCNGIVYEFGHFTSDKKINNFAELGAMPFSILAFHNRFLADCRNAFVIGAYYPALTGACALGERILNHLILLLREDYRNTPEYKHVYRKDSFDNWSLAINTLLAWGVLLVDVVNDFKELSSIRNRSIHFQPEVDTNDRSLALEALRVLQRIVGNQFSSFGNQAWFLNTIPGEIYIKKEWEVNPFIKKIYLPNCRLVGFNHYLDLDNNKWIIHDDKNYANHEISDDEFSKFRINRDKKI